MRMSFVANNLEHIRQQIREAEQHYQRESGSVQLIAVSKSQPIAYIQQAIEAGQYRFGENYIQEAITKIHAFNNPHLEWHFIGAIQSNKTRLLAESFAWIHTVDRLAIAERLHHQRPAELPPLNICIQVNLDAKKKTGVSLGEIYALANAMAQLPRLKLCGLMTIPAPHGTFDEQRHTFHKLKIALQELQRQGLSVNTLSMGMSEDFVAAIAEGTTFVRIGTAIFGKRN